MKSEMNRARLGRVTVPVLAVSVAMSISLFASTEVLAADPMSMPAQQMEPSKMEGMKGMDGMSMTGDADYDFAVNMRKHHQMALTMAETELKNGKNPQMQQMAKNIIAAQKKEIASFDKWIAAYKAPAMK